MPDSSMLSRVSQRHKVAIASTCRSSAGNILQVILEDISPEGCCISSQGRFLLSVGESVSIHPESFFGLRGKIRWLKSNRAGIEFCRPLDQMDLERLLRMNSDRRPWAAGPATSKVPDATRQERLRPARTVRSGAADPAVPVSDAILDIYARGEFDAAKAIWLEVVSLLLSKGILTRSELAVRLSDIERTTAKLNKAYPQARQLLDATKDIREAAGLPSDATARSSRRG